MIKKMKHKINKAISLLMIAALSFTAINGGIQPTYAAEAVKLTTSEVVNSNNMPQGPILAGTELAFTTITTGATILLSINGGEYAPKSEVVITSDASIKAKATKVDLTDSAVSTFNYSVPAFVKIKDARLLPDKTNVAVEGTVTAIIGNEIFIQDDEAGIIISKLKWKPSGNANCKVGDSVIAAGVKEDYFTNGNIYTSSSAAIKVMGTGVATPKVITASQMTEAVEGQLVTLKMPEVGTKIGNAYSLIDNTGIAYANIGKLSSSLFEAGTRLKSITGVVKTYVDNNKVSTIQINPRNEADIVEIILPKASPQGGSVKEGDVATLNYQDVTAKIYYEIGATLDTVKTPTEASKLYNATPIVLDSKNRVIKAIAVKQGMNNSEVATFEYYFVDFKIGDIQGSAHMSPYNGKFMSNIKGVITAIDNKNKGFYMQSKDMETDNNPLTSDAVYVMNAPTGYAVGDYISVGGTVTEYIQSKPVGSLSITQLTKCTITKLSSGADIPAPYVIGLNGHIPPKNNIDDDNFKQFDPQNDAIDFFEAIEGMLVVVEKPLVGASYKGSSNLTISVVPNEGKVSPEKITKYNGFKLTEGSENPELIQIGDILFTNDIAGKVPQVGDQYEENIVGIMAYDYGKYALMNAVQLPKFTSNPLRKREITSIVPAEDKLTIASYNVENFNSKTDDVRKNGIARSIVENLKAPDIIGLVEMQDDDGKVKNTGSAAGETFKALIDEIAKVSNGAEKYEYVQIDPIYDQDGGESGANIRVGFIYKPSRVQLATAKVGDATTAVALNNGHLTLNPGRIIPTDQTIFDSTRKSLATEFIFKNQSYFVIANHFSSKSGSSPVFGAVQPFIDPPLADRIKQAETVNTFIKQIIATNPNAKVVALGDFNDFEFTKAARALAGTEMTNMHDTLPLGERVTYIFNGSSQVLDHILVSKNMVNASNFDPVNINAMFLASEGRVSDHDPVLIQINPSAIAYVKPAKDNEDKSNVVAKPSTTTPPLATPTPIKTPISTTIKPMTQGEGTIVKNSAGETKMNLMIESKKLDAQLKDQTTTKIQINASEEKGLNQVTVQMNPDLFKSAQLANKSVEVKTETARISIAPGSLNLLTDKPVALSANTVGETEKTAIMGKMPKNNFVSVGGFIDFGFETVDGVKSSAVEFLKPMVITMNFDASKIKNLEKVGVYNLNETTNKWEFVGSKMNAAGELVFSVNHFSTYAIMESNKVFKDSVSWAKNPIEVLAARQLISGISADQFAPERKVTRAEFTQMIVASLNLKAKDSKITFKDVRADKWYKNAVGIAADNGLIVGDKGNFSPDAELTREQMFNMINKAVKLSGSKTAEIKSTETTITGDATRAQAAVVIYNLLKAMGEI